MIKHYKGLGAYAKLIIKWYNHRTRIFFFIMDLLLKKKHRVSFFMFPAKYEMLTCRQINMMMHNTTWPNSMYMYVYRIYQLQLGRNIFNIFLYIRSPNMKFYILQNNVKLTGNFYCSLCQKCWPKWFSLFPDLSANNSSTWGFLASVTYS